jgi:outer membrane receptor protein involved in Fe transport
LPPLDRLSGAGGQPRHQVSMQLMAGRSGLGAMLNGQWQSAARVDNSAIPDGAGDLRFSALAQVTLSLFAEPGTLLAPGSTKKTWASNLRISLDVQNLFDSYQRVTLADGGTAPGYDRYALNPLGRTIQVTVRKRF